ncbi:carnosine N-methyltransferase-like [Rhopilema esculentum]|uniref:carnosine N-methyltransferase-like n=1 Tax=Rhopilema esculentum TaxID=499914 RepID=UPI0031E01D41|eukprot:gene12008-2592_t
MADGATDVEFSESLHQEDPSKYIKDEEEEQDHFHNVIRAFLAYNTSSLRKLQKRVKDFMSIPVWHRKLAPNYAKRLKDCKTCIEENYKLVKSIINFTNGMFQNAEFGPPGQGSVPVISPEDESKVVTTLTQIVRDWAEEGAEERHASYGPILRAMNCYLPAENRGSIGVLVPGAGLGRLVYETAKLGFNCQGNEFSLYMLFGSNFILNQVDGENSITYYPWVHQYCNIVKPDNHIAAVKFPDVNPRELPQDAKLSMAAGDFLEVYTEPNCWDCIATCFFIDTAHNIMAYIEKINEILKPGGYWINNGPLLYHFADIPGEVSIDLSYEEIKKIITEDFKFELLEENLDGMSHYIQNPRSLLKMTYNCIFFVARKPV